MTRLASTASLVFLQPTTLCNLNCSYCYLPGRSARRRMSVEVADAVARGVAAWSLLHPVRVVWHGGEPLSLGVPGFTKLIERFRNDNGRVTHAVQTNATLINNAWCEVFKRHKISVNVSLDGPRLANRARTTRAGQESFELALRGIATLRTQGIPYGAISVVEEPDPDLAAELYDWFVTLGCRSLGINIAERKGVHAGSHVDNERVTAFWTALTTRWRTDQRLRIRELDHALRYVSATLAKTSSHRTLAPYDPMPMVSWDGEVTVLGPDLAGFSSRRHGPFTVGNVKDTDLTDLIRRAPQVAWVTETMQGFAACRATCDHFNYCLGGQPANKYFETGRFDVTETVHCRNSKKRLMEGLLRSVRHT
ncbi:cyclophane-forming radical SAM peptide maturase AmcB [Streptomyces collinus]|uniref:cyclophane-forming radical SAM peptide maturase AmcB n=1 Tax=Streptomyces collinus TaxID=42684 RepID=UPI002943BEF9|nr:cyclophane-forming radical SAM peptide maturase AmcB [Streptomyces collinus]